MRQYQFKAVWKISGETFVKSGVMDDPDRLGAEDVADWVRRDILDTYPDAGLTFPDISVTVTPSRQ